MNLYKSEINEEVIVEKVNFAGREKKRLYDLGIIPGSKIKKEYKSIFGNPIAYSVKKTLLAIRNEDAKNIEVYKSE